MSRLEIRLLLYSYWGLLYTSLFVFHHPRLQLLATALWLALAVVTSRRAVAAGLSVQRLLCVTACSQLPGLVAASSGLASAIANTPSEIANGILELWTHPFFPLLEQLPQGSVYGMSVAFVTACLIPLVCACLPVLLGTWRVKVVSGRRKLAAGWLTRRQKV